MAFFGRKIIYTDIDAIDADNIVDVLRGALSTHTFNARQIEYLYRYYRGEQPIIYREKMIRPEINNKIVENHALEIVDFKKGYVFGEPVQYVRRGEADNVSKTVAELNDLMFAEDKQAKDEALAEWFFICGTSYRMILPDAEGEEDECPFEIDALDPRYAFVVYHNGFGKKPVMGVKFITTNTGKVRYSVYTKDEYFEIESGVIVLEQGHVLGGIPIIEYPANSSRLGAFEVVLGLLDALNTTTSNRIDGIEQFIQSFMKFINCDIDEDKFTALKELGALTIKGEPGNPADVDIVTSELNQSQTQITKDDLYQMVLIICGMPDRNGRSSGGDTGQAVILRDGWSSAESRARDTEIMFKGAEKQFLKLALRILKDTRQMDLKLSEIDIKFNRNKTDNLLVKVQGLQGMLESGVHPQIAITNSNLFSDPEQTYLDSLAYLDKWLDKKVEVVPSNNKSNPE